ncbi:TVP38/TMEM64 family protein [Thermodesulfobacteriota bacterium]
MAVTLYFFRIPVWEMLTRYYDLLTNREQIKVFVTSFGIAAPIVFMGIQILQVLFAPIPGEVTGFIGGALFGATKGFIYSSVALTVGSWLNFSIGRFLGKHYIRQLIPADILDRFDRMLKHQGVIVCFILFLIPGFPKDYLCLFLGLSSIPFKIFILLAAFGRMPGTLMLSLQGAFLFNQSYGFFALIFGMCLVVVVLGYRYRNTIYQWIERVNNR